VVRIDDVVARLEAALRDLDLEVELDSAFGYLLCYVGNRFLLS
jgi:hypothetical protein